MANLGWPFHVVVCTLVGKTELYVVYQILLQVLHLNFTKCSTYITGLGFDILVLIRICPQLVQVIRIGFINEISSSTTSFKYAQKFIHNQEKAPTESNLTRPECEVVI